MYIPDFTVRALTDVQFIKVRRHQYVAAQRATLMERAPKTPRSNSDQAPEDPFSSEWKKAKQMTQRDCEEGTLHAPYLRQHQRNYSSGNLEDLRLRRDIKLSPLIISNSSHTDDGPIKTVIYPEHRSPRPSSHSPDHEKIHLLGVSSHNGDSGSGYNENS